MLVDDVAVLVAGFCVLVADVGMLVDENRTLVAGFCVLVIGKASVVGEEVIAADGDAETVAGR